MLRKEIKKTLGRLIFEERQRNNTSIAACCRALQMGPVAYEKIELGLDRNNWDRYEKALNYFHKSVKIELVAAPKRNKHPS